MMFIMLGIALFLLPILFRLALKLRLGIPMLYALLALTVFHSWYQAHTVLGDGIFLALIAVAALSWIVTLLRRFAGLVEGWREERAMEELLAYRVRQASNCWQVHHQHRRTVELNYPSPINSRMSRSLILIAPTNTSILKINSPT